MSGRDALYAVGKADKAWRWRAWLPDVDPSNGSQPSFNGVAATKEEATKAAHIALGAAWPKANEWDGPFSLPPRFAGEALPPPFGSSLIYRHDHCDCSWFRDNVTEEEHAKGHTRKFAVVERSARFVRVSDYSLDLGERVALADIESGASPFTFDAKYPHLDELRDRQRSFLDSAKASERRERRLAECGPPQVEVVHSRPAAHITTISTCMGCFRSMVNTSETHPKLVRVHEDGERFETVVCWTCATKVDAKAARSMWAAPTGSAS